jgi:SRSO17 transposase
MTDFASAFSRRDQLALGTVYLKGLLSDNKRKSVEPIALRYLGTPRVRALQRFMTTSPWDHETLQIRYQKRLGSLIADDDGVLTVDSSEIPKKGKESVGVARQYCGRLGKKENCQSGVFVGYASSKGYGLLSTQLYMPRKWFDDDHIERRQACGVPKDLTFQTKPKIAEKLINDIRDQGDFPARWVVADATFGSVPAFRDALHPDYYYLAQVL